jgi:coproporphyrinogen III oxidase
MLPKMPSINRLKIKMMHKEAITTWLMELQDHICERLEKLDGKGKFIEDAWQRDGGGGGRSRVIQGTLIEKGGVNFSAVHGEMSEKTAKTLHMAAGSFYATGVSIVLHPKNPNMPIIHKNIRYFENEGGQWWFGGGIDLTPHYVVKEDAQFFHQSLKAVCDRAHPDFYQKHKTWADDYFYIRHRKETRGIGGIFFDRQNSENTPLSKEELLAYIQNVGMAFCPIYEELAQRNRAEPFTKQQQKWQALRRGRYVEFNLVWDAGTKFGLETDGRTESILMSLPPMAQWVYDFRPKKDSREAETLGFLKKEMDWIG